MLRLLHPTDPAPDDSVIRIATERVRALAVLGGRAFTLEGDGQLVARALPGGTVLWSRGSTGRRLAAVGGRVVVAEREGVALLDPDDGAVDSRLTLGRSPGLIAGDVHGALVLAFPGGEVCGWEGGVLQPLPRLRGRVAAIDRRGPAVVVGLTDGRLLTARIGGGGWRVVGAEGAAISAVSLGADGTLVAARADGDVRVWCLRTGQERRALAGADGAVELLIGGDGRLFGAGAERLVHRWDAVDGSALGPLAGHRCPILGLGLDGEGRLWSAGRDGALLGWEVGLTNPRSALLGHGGGVRACAITGRLGFTGSRDGSVRAWDLVEGTLAAVWWRGSATVTSLCLPPGGGLLLGCSDGSLVCLSAPGRIAWRQRSAHRGPVTCLDCLGELVVSGGGDGTLRLWDGGGGAPVVARPDHTSRIRCMGPEPSGERVATGGYDGSLVLASPFGGDALVRVPDAHDGPVVGCAWAGDSLLTVGMDGALRRWDARLECIGEARAHAGGAVGVVPVAGGRAASVGGDGRVCLWELGAAGAPGLDMELALERGLDGLGAGRWAGGPLLLVGDRHGGVHAVIVDE